MSLPSPRSPKRRKILASINPVEGDVDSSGAGDTARQHRRYDHIAPPSPGQSHQQQTTANDMPAPEAGRRPSSPAAGDDDTGYKRSKTTKFRFKSSRDSESSRRHRSSRRDEDDNNDNNDDDSSRRHRHHRRHHRRRHDDDDDDTKDKDNDRDRDRDPEPRPHRHHHHPAFRESLFDAMADDEGAAYWEGVYGQPIHVYGEPTVQTTDPHTGAAKAEHMTDDEYAAYVRQKMWEKTHAGLLEERARREERRKEERRAEEERGRVREEVERSLRRGERRRRGREARGRWEGYGVGGDGEKREELAERVRAFFVEGLDLEGVGEKEFAARLKEERVRWHPDKMQQRLGGTVDEAVMRDVTMIFQIIDRLWNDTRKGGGG
ncbi:hypothetical protein B0T17DRAFT_607608 [Bombardia bombarda]|uniref:Uncharacterized protein n=1 Tax=Bombardia bombarda TaxID=252184 RepID=A0AA39XBD2_9PEZI|nr:hypothetical protein B0T17DRAFT_607608 [Bombardia bombarda]